MVGESPVESVVKRCDVQQPRQGAGFHDAHGVGAIHGDPDRLLERGEFPDMRGVGRLHIVAGHAPGRAAGCKPARARQLFDVRDTRLAADGAPPGAG